jgi:hypothetical protein
MRDPLSLETFADWLEQQPAAARYNYTDSRNCAVAQYLGALGFKNVDYRAWDGRPCVGEGPRVPRDLFIVSREGEMTFGAAAERARAYLAFASADGA